MSTDKVDITFDTAASLSLSFSRRRPALYILVSPSAAAASTEITGTRSGMSEASISVPRRFEGDDTTCSSVTITLPPNFLIMSTIFLSPCTDSGFSPVTATEFLPTAPAHSQNAALDQSPSTDMLSGALKRPKTAYSIPIRRTSAPHRRRHSAVISMYEPDSTLPVSSTVPPPITGIASKSPLMNWDDTSPGIVKSLPFSLPRTLRGETPCADSAMPWRQSSS